MDENDDAMKLVALKLGDKENTPPADKMEEHFLDPITNFRALHDNDIEILLLVGKEKVTGLGSAQVNFLSKGA